MPTVATLTPPDGLLYDSRYDSPSGNDRSGNDRSGNDRSGNDRSGNDRSGNNRSGHYDSNWHCPPNVRALLQQARHGLLDAEYATRSVERYAHAHLAALRAAAAVLAVRARPRRRAQPTSAWTLLARVAPELAEWSAFFAAASATRAAAEAGVHGLVTNRDADDMVRQAGQFLALAQRAATRTSR